MLILTLFFGCRTSAAPPPRESEPIPEAIPSPEATLTIHIPPDCDRYILDVQPDRVDRWDPSKVYPGSVIIACMSEYGGTTDRQDLPYTAEVHNGVVIDPAPTAPPRANSPSAPLASKP